MNLLFIYLFSFRPLLPRVTHNSDAYACGESFVMEGYNCIVGIGENCW